MTTEKNLPDRFVSPLFAMGSWLRRGTASDDARQLFLEGGREADAFYRNRWSYDKVVRSTHGVNCTGSCSWKIYVKDGIITWETQQTDYPSTGADMPEYEPRGCPRGAAFSWYEYSPTRIKYPYVRGVLLDMFQEAKKRLGDPVLAWGDIVENPDKARAYKSQRGRGGMVRVSWEEAMEIVAAAYVHTIKEYGPDRIAGFSVIPAMSMISYGAGSRFHELIGATMLSFYDWYADLPPASPQFFGDQTDVPESGDWFNSQYLIMWGTNLPLTRTPDAHFMAEARYHGQKVVVVSPDYADNTKFADDWLRIQPGTDGALAIAMGHVILTEFHVAKREPFFRDYMTRYSDAPFLVEINEVGADAREGIPGQTLTPGKFLTADKMPQGTTERTQNNAFRPLVIEADGTVKDPGGTLADRFGDEGAGHWNLNLDGVSPVLSMMDTDQWESIEIALPRFDLPASPAQASIGGGYTVRGVPARRINGRLVTTVYDILLAQYGVARDGLGGQWPTGYDDASTPGTPAWQEEHTGVPAGAAIKIGREFALNAIETEGRSMILMGAGTNHYFNSDQIYRSFLALTTMCGTQGRNGGGWAHYVGQEKVRPITGWASFTFATDWHRPPRQMISTGWYYMTTDQWRYDGARASSIGNPLKAPHFEGKQFVDTLVESVQRGWMPSYPTFDRSSTVLGREAAEAGMSPGDYVSSELRAGRLRFAMEDPDAHHNVPKILANWRTNLLGSSAKGTEFFLRHMLGANNDVNAAELQEGNRPSTMTWRDEAHPGKLDLMWVADFRNTSTTLHSDVVLPAATWYEKHDLSSTDMHPFMHSFNAAVNPPWEARTDFEMYQSLAHLVSAMAADHLGTQTDVVAVPLAHDSPDAMAMPSGIVPEQTWTPGVTMPKLVPVERDYTQIGHKFDRIGPLASTLGFAQKGIVYDTSLETEELGDLNGRAPMDGNAGEGRPLCDTDIKACNMALRFSGTTNGRLATQGFRTLEKRTGTEMAYLSEGDEEKRITFIDTRIQPRSVITSPEWSGSEHGGRRYSAFVQNVECFKPWHTLTGRPQFYIDHDWMLDMGEALPVFRPPLNLAHLYGERPIGDVRANSQTGAAEVAVRYLTIHNKWAIHSQYYDNPHMLTLGRGGQTIWMSPQDADKIGVRDNEWIEATNRNGTVTARAVVSHRIPEGTVFMHHAQDRQINTPLNESSGRRGGTHNSLTRIFLKPTHLAGGYAQFAYAFNYYGPTGNQRDEVTVIRRRSQEVQF